MKKFVVLTSALLMSVSSYAVVPNVVLRSLEEVKAVCDDPESVGHQRNPKEISILCQEVRCQYKYKGDEYVDVMGPKIVDGKLMSEKFNIHKQREVAPSSNKFKCPVYFLERTKTKTMPVTTTCQEVSEFLAQHSQKDQNSLLSFCRERLEQNVWQNLGESLKLGLAEQEDLRRDVNVCSGELPSEVSAEECLQSQSQKPGVSI